MHLIYSMAWQMCAEYYPNQIKPQHQMFVCVHQLCETGLIISTCYDKGSNQSTRQFQLKKLSYRQLKNNQVLTHEVMFASLVLQTQQCDG